MINVTGIESLSRQDLFKVMGFTNNFGYYWGKTTNGILINDEIMGELINRNTVGP